MVEGTLISVAEGVEYDCTCVQQATGNKCVIDLNEANIMKVNKLMKKE